MKELFAENWSYLSCDQCKHCGKNCKRLFGVLSLAKPWFASVAVNSTVCRDFEPQGRCVWLAEHWNGYDDYYGSDTPKGVIALNIDGNTEMTYYIRAEDFVNGTMFDDDGNLKWIKREWYRKVKKTKKTPVGYVRECIKNIRGNNNE